MTDTTTQWRGLHNPERHFSAFGTGTPLCEECGDALCVPSNPCYCCLEAEVEVLRAFVPESLRYPKRNGEFINIGPECFSDEEELVICWKGRNYYADPADEVNLIAEVEALRARNETLIATIQRQDSTFERQMEEHEELEALRAQVQRVREACEPFGPMGSIAVWRVLRAALALTDLPDNVDGDNDA